MGFSEDDRIRQKNQVPKEDVKVDEHRFKLELYNKVKVTQVVEALVKAGLSVQLERGNKIIVKD